MKLRILPFVLSSTSLLAACADLVVSDIRPAGPPTASGGSVVYPLEVEVTNQGGGSAGPFKVSAQYTGGVIAPGNSVVVPFDDTPGPPPSWYPMRNTPLGPGASATFRGDVIFHPREHGVTVSLTAKADSCAGDEFMPSHCRVRESNEGNNVSSPVSLALP